jgi:CRP/FNR family transcriptional regulator, anaerobic regulatory protein
MPTVSQRKVDPRNCPDPHNSACIICQVREKCICAAFPLQLSPHKIEQRVAISPAYQRARPQEIIYRRGEPLDSVFVLCHGWAISFVELPGGRRHIYSVILPGDLFSTTALFVTALPFAVQAITDVMFARYDRAELKAHVAADPTILEAIGMVDAEERARLKLASLSLGQARANERIAGLLLRLARRLSSRAIKDGCRFELPLHQQDIADLAGLTLTHVNRVLGQFRNASILEISRGTMTVLNAAALEKLGSIAS